MLVSDLKVGDIVTRIGDLEHKYLVTSTRATRGIKDYVALLGPYGHSDDVWVKYVKEVVGHIDVNYIFEELLGGSDEQKI